MPDASPLFISLGGDRYNDSLVDGVILRFCYFFFSKNRSTDLCIIFQRCSCTYKGCVQNKT